MIDGPGFLGFGPGACAFFAGLAESNEKAWFEANRETWERDVKRPLSAFLEEAASRRGGRTKMFRLNRDVRFSADKSPYKTEAAGLLRREGRLPLYVAVSAKGFAAGTGLPGPDAKQLAALRAAIGDEETGPRLEVAVEAAKAGGVEVFGDAVATAPRGWPKDHPRIGLLRMKQLLMIRRIGPDAALDGRRPFDFALETWRLLDPAMAEIEAAVPL